MRARMSKAQRLTVYLIVGALWLSGCVWLCLDQFFSQAGPFGSTPNFLQPPLLLIHGVLALLCLYLFGYISSHHIVRWWRSHFRRLSGGTFAAILAILTLGGFALFFVSDDQWQHVLVQTHDGLGIVVTAFALQHWLFARRPNATKK
jgi:cytochrome b561